MGEDRHSKQLTPGKVKESRGRSQEMRKGKTGKGKVRMSINGVQVTATCTYTGLTEDIIERFNELLARAALKGTKHKHEA